MDAVAFARQRITDVEQLAWRHKKINLMLPISSDSDAVGISESVWCVPKTTADARRMNCDTSVDEKFRVYLTNMPLSWGGRVWGAEVIGTTCGAARPMALPKDQAPLDTDARLLWEGLKAIDGLAGSPQSGGHNPDGT